ncbi:MAG: formylglycine-generating enzyme family protein [Burkholderiales bacterium]
MITGTIGSRQGREIRIQAPIEQQTSGGPLLRNQRVLGLITTTLGAFANAITVRGIQDYLDGALPPGVLGSAPSIPSTPPVAKPEPPPIKPAPVDPPRPIIAGPKPLFAPYETGKVFQECEACPEMVVIVPDARGFTIGSPENEVGRDANEQPFGPIRIGKPYAIGRFEITRGQIAATSVRPGSGCYAWDGKEWKQDANASWERPGFAQAVDHPAVCVNWSESQEYVAWLNRQARTPGGNAYRLPTEAEWEFAARGDTTTARYWGNDAERACEYANVADRTSKEKLNWPTIHECTDGFVYTAPVGRFKANKFGLHDILGNAWERVQDCVQEQYDETIRAGQSVERENCDRRMVRGGAWYGGPAYVRSAIRSGNPPANRDYFVGFRVARTLP